MMDDLDEDVARLKAKWLAAGVTPPRALDAEEEAIAARWLSLGPTEARKLATTTGDRRYRPPVVLAHWGYIPTVRDDWRTVAKPGYFYVETFRGSEKATLFEGDKIGCMKVVDRLQRMRVSVTRVGQERSAEELHGYAKAPPVRSARFAILDQLKDFRA